MMPLASARDRVLLGYLVSAENEPENTKASKRSLNLSEALGYLIDQEA